MRKELKDLSVGNSFMFYNGKRDRLFYITRKEDNVIYAQMQPNGRTYALSKLDTWVFRITKHIEEYETFNNGVLPIVEMPEYTFEGVDSFVGEGRTPYEAMDDAMRLALYHGYDISDIDNNMVDIASVEVDDIDKNSFVSLFVEK